MPIVEYESGKAFPGVIGRTADESSPAWPAPVRAREGAPNVLFIVLDDTGFGNLGCYGSPIETPNFDAIAANGLRYNNMHTTALCSPSRSCIVTGRNHHSNGMACITELASGYPGYNGVLPFENGLLSEMLLEHGYSTFMVGKWHLTPSNQETAAGPYDRWPLGRGFQRFYGFLGGDTSQWHPDLVYDNHQVEPPKKPEDGYHLSEDLVDKAVSFIADTKQADPQKPFYLHLCFGATRLTDRSCGPSSLRGEDSRVRAHGLDGLVDGPCREVDTVCLAESPLAFECLLEAFDLAVGLWSARPDEEVVDRSFGEQLAQRAVVAVGPGVVAHQPLHVDPVAGEVSEAPLDEGGHGRRFLVAVEFAVGVAGVVVDERVHPFVADSLPLVGGRHVSVAGDGVTGPGEADEALAVDVQQVARTRPLIEQWPLARCPRPP